MALSEIESIIAGRQNLESPFVTSTRSFDWELKTTGSSLDECFYVTSPVILMMGDHRLPAFLMTSSGKGPAKAFDVALYVDFSSVSHENGIKDELKHHFSGLVDSEETIIENSRQWRLSRGASVDIIGLVRSVPTGIVQAEFNPLAARDPRVKFDEFAQVLSTIYQERIQIRPANIVQQYLL